MCHVSVLKYAKIYQNVKTQVLSLERQGKAHSAEKVYCAKLKI